MPGQIIFIVVIPGIDWNYDINDIVTANLTKSQVLSGHSGHSLGLQYGGSYMEPGDFV